MMDCQDEFSQHYAEKIEGEYDCVDRIGVNGYFPPGSSGGGMRVCWNRLQGKVVARLPDLAGRLRAMTYRFLNVLRALHVSFPGGEDLDALSQPSQRGKRRVGGLDLTKERVRAAIGALIALSPQPGGFTVAELASQVRIMTGWEESRYHHRHATYDLSKMRAKGIVQRREGTRRLEAVPQGLQTVCGLLTLREKVIKPVLAGVKNKTPAPIDPRKHGPIDVHYHNLQREMRRAFETLGLAG